MLVGLRLDLYLSVNPFWKVDLDCQIKSNVETVLDWIELYNIVHLPHLSGELFCHMWRGSNCYDKLLGPKYKQKLLQVWKDPENESIKVRQIHSNFRISDIKFDGRFW